MSGVFLEYSKRERVADGCIHIVGVTASIVALAALLFIGAKAEATLWVVALVIYGLALVAMFSCSAGYHLISRPMPKEIFRRLDHASIFLLIAGTYTPLAVCALVWPKSVILLSIIWAGAGLGILFRVFFIHAPRWLYVPLYVALGFGAFVFIADFYAADAAMMTLILVGGLLYTIGAVIYGMKRPNPFPGRFGFHEIFHTCTLLAFLCHWVGILLVATNPPVFG
ncbi:MAG: hemolysin III family protein [Methyloceanibacter sp.]